MTDDQAKRTREPLVDHQRLNAPDDGRRSRRVLLGAVIGGAVAGVGIGAVWIGLRGGNEGPGLVFVIPAGAGEAVGYSTLVSAIEMPTQIRFEPGETAAITVRNEDAMLLRAGPFLVGPGQTYTQRFPDPGEYPIACTVNPAESITVTVVA
jgi:hypothetical protein